jgi:hypothetical protein
MPTVLEEGRYRFVIFTNENNYEPPHVHVFVDNEDTCRLELNGGQFMEGPPHGHYRNIMNLYREHAEAIREQWDRVHRR